MSDFDGQNVKCLCITDLNHRVTISMQRYMEELETFLSKYLAEAAS